MPFSMPVEGAGFVSVSISGGAASERIAQNAFKNAFWPYRIEIALAVSKSIPNTSAHFFLPRAIPVAPVTAQKR
jgi:hypothetical protein